MKPLRSWAALLRRTPLHPQWLLGPRRPPAGLAAVRGAVLDIGSADRWIWPHLPLGVDYVALDYPATGRDLYGTRPDIFADAALLPFRDAAFDAVICLEVLEHVAQPDRVLAEIARVLKPGGKVWFSMPFLYPIHDAPYDYQRLTEHGWRRDISRCGLDLLGLRKSMHSVHSAGLLACLALAGGVMASRGVKSWLLALMMLVMVPLINCLAYVLGKLVPDWQGFGAGYLVQARKP